MTDTATDVMNIKASRANIIMNIKKDISNLL